MANTRTTQTLAVGGGLFALGVGAYAALILRERTAEHPDFETVGTDGPVELRDYPAVTVAEVTTPGDHLAALDQGYRRLSDYITAKDRDGDRIAMNVPVLSDRKGSQWRTRFVMPGDTPRDALPRPATPVMLAYIPARRVAAIRFSGRSTEQALAEAERRLREWLLAHGHKASGVAEYAYYNSPFTLPPLCRTEVLIALDPAE